MSDDEANLDPEAAVDDEPGAAASELDGPASVVSGGRPSLRSATASVGNWFQQNLSAEARLGAKPSKARQELESAKTPRQRSEAERRAVNGLEPREARFGLFAVVAEVALTLVVVVPYLLNEHKKTSGSVTRGALYTFLVEGVILGVFLLLGVLTKRRAMLGFASLITGLWLLQLKSLAIIGVAYLGFGIWLVVRAARFNPKRKQSGSTSDPSTPSKPAPAKSALKKSSVAARSTPKPNKRYTPPQPPSRRDLAKKQAAAAAEAERAKTAKKAPAAAESRKS